MINALIYFTVLFLLACAYAYDRSLVKKVNLVINTGRASNEIYESYWSNYVKQVLIIQEQAAQEQAEYFARAAAGEKILILYKEKAN